LGRVPSDPEATERTVADRLVTIADVARRAGVSIATVSRVLSPGPAHRQRHPVSAATTERVLHAARDLNFVPSDVARGLAARRTGMIGLLVPDLTDPHYPHIAAGVELAAREHGLAVLICNTLGDPARVEDYLRLLRGRRVDAVVLSGGSSLTRDDLSIVADSGLPLVLIGRPAHTVVQSYVTVDNVEAAAQATSHLIHIGRTRVAHLAGPLGQTTMRDRHAGYRAGMARHFAAPLIEFETDGRAEHAYEVIRDQVAAGTEFDGLFAATDRLAIGAMAALHDAGRRIPEDVAVIGFDDIPLAAMLRPALASVTQPARELGEAAVRLAVAVAAREGVSPIMLQATPVIRASAAGKTAPSDMDVET
jgi:LacI family transcriptional regulator